MSGTLGCGQTPDYWNPSQRLTGPATITATVPLDRLPLYIVRLLTELPLQVSHDGQALPQLSSSSGLETVHSGWFYDGAIGRLWIKLSTDGGATAIEVTL